MKKYKRNLILLMFINIVVLATMILSVNFLSGIILTAMGPDSVKLDGTKDYRVQLPVYPDKEAAKAIFRDFYQTRSAYSPYEAMRLAPFNSQTTNIAEDGLRRTPSQPEMADQIVRFFGGSTMWGTGVDDNHTIPALTLAKLAKIGAINYGQSGFVSRQNLAVLIKELSLGVPIDIVIFYDGVNDVYHLCQSRTSLSGHGFEYFLKRAVEDYQSSKAQTPDRLWRASLGNIYDLAKSFAGPEVRQTTDIAAVPPSRCDTNPDAIPAIVNILWRNWLIGKTLVESSGGRFLAILQPVSSVGEPRKDHLTPTPNWDTWYQRAYILLRQRIEAAEGDWVLDFSDSFDVDQPLYSDWSHVNSAGNEIIASRISAELLRRGWVH